MDQYFEIRIKQRKVRHLLTITYVRNGDRAFSNVCCKNDFSCLIWAGDKHTLLFIAGDDRMERQHIPVPVFPNKIEESILDINQRMYKVAKLSINSLSSRSISIQ